MWYSITKSTYFVLLENPLLLLNNNLKQFYFMTKSLLKATTIHSTGKKKVVFQMDKFNYKNTSNNPDLF